MTKIISWAGVLAAAALTAAGCGDDDFIVAPRIGTLQPGDAGPSAGTGGGAAGNASSAGGAGGAAAGASSSAAAGTGGGSASSSGEPEGDAGIADAVDAGSADASVVAPAPVDEGPCTEAGCACAVDVITAVPYSAPWQTNENTEGDVVDIPGCQICDNTADHILTFTPPATATYRFVATSGGDVELAVYPGDCTATPNDVACGTDIDLEGGDYDDQLEVELTAGVTVTVVVGESCEENGGAGTLTIDLVP